MKKNKKGIIQRIAQKRAEKNRKREQYKLETRDKPTSPREIRADKSDNEKKEYLFYLDSKYSSTDDKEELRGRIKKEHFKEPEIKADILSTDFEVQELEQSEDTYQDKKLHGINKIKNWYYRIKEYWVRNYPELIVKEILVKAFGVLIFGFITFILGFWLQGSMSDKEIEKLRKEFDQKIINSEDKDDVKINKINSDVDNKIKAQLNILKVIQDINNVKSSD